MSIAHITETTDTDEKKHVNVVEDTFPNLSSSSDTASEDGEAKLLFAEIRPLAERRLVRKLDFSLMPLVILIYIVNYIDVR